nr:MAG: hypothetical protein [Apis mellifera filamentous virus]
MHGAYGMHGTRGTAESKQVERGCGRRGKRRAATQLESVDGAPARVVRVVARARRSGGTNGRISLSVTPELVGPRSSGVSGVGGSGPRLTSTGTGISMSTMVSSGVGVRFEGGNDHQQLLYHIGTDENEEEEETKKEKKGETRATTRGRCRMSSRRRRTDRNRAQRRASWKKRGGGRTNRFAAHARDDGDSGEDGNDENDEPVDDSDGNDGSEGSDAGDRRTEVDDVDDEDDRSEASDDSEESVARDDVDETDGDGLDGVGCDDDDAGDSDTGKTEKYSDGDDPEDKYRYGRFERSRLAGRASRTSRAGCAVGQDGRVGATRVGVKVGSLDSTIDSTIDGMFGSLPVNRFLCEVLRTMAYPGGRSIMGAACGSVQKSLNGIEPGERESRTVSDGRSGALNTVKAANATSAIDATKSVSNVSDVSDANTSDVTDTTAGVQPQQSSQQSSRAKRGGGLSRALLNRITSSAFMRMTKKMRQQVLTRMFNGVHNQLVVYNIKSLFRIYLIYHREDALIHTICDVFNKRFVFDAAQLRAEILAKNTKPFSRKVMRNKVCNDVMMSNPHILRLFDLRALAYYRNHLVDSARYLHCLSNGLPVIMCLNESDVDYIFDRCRAAHSRRRDFPIDLLPSCIRESFARLLGLSARGNGGSMGARGLVRLVRPDDEEDRATGNNTDQTNKTDKTVKVGGTDTISAKNDRGNSTNPARFACPTASSVETNLNREFDRNSGHVVRNVGLNVGRHVVRNVGWDVGRHVVRNVGRDRDGGRYNDRNTRNISQNMSRFVGRNIDRNTSRNIGRSRNFSGRDFSSINTNVGENFSCGQRVETTTVVDSNVHRGESCFDGSPRCTAGTVVTSRASGRASDSASGRASGDSVDGNTATGVFGAVGTVNTAVFGAAGTSGRRIVTMITGSNVGKSTKIPR